MTDDYFNELWLRVNAGLPINNPQPAQQPAVSLEGES